MKEKESNWYDGLYGEPDDNALARALVLLEDLRGALPHEKQGAVDEAKALLLRAVDRYRQLRAQQKGAAHK